MVDQIAVVTVTTPDGPAPVTLDITSPLITEPFSAAILIFSGFTTDGADATEAILGMGFVTPTNAGLTGEEEAMCVSGKSLASGAPNCVTHHSAGISGTAACIIVQDPALTSGAAAILTAEYDSSIAGGVRLNFDVLTDTDPGAPVVYLRIKVTAILFAGLARAATSQCTASTIGAAESVGGSTPFEPDLVLFLASQSQTNVAANNAVPNLGFALNKAGLPQVCVWQRWSTVVSPTDADGFMRAAAGYGHFPSGVTVEYASQTFSATGFTSTSNASSPDAHYLALKFSGAFRMACAHLSVAASTGEQSFNDFGFTPDVVVGMSHLLTTVDTLTDGPLLSAAGYFVTGRFADRSYTASYAEGVAVGNPKVGRSRQEDAIVQYDHTGAVVQRATWAGATGAGGFKLNFSTASAAGTLTALGIQLIPNPPLPIRHASVRRLERALLRRHPFFIAPKAPVSPPPPVSRLLALVARARRAMQKRLRWRPRVQEAPEVVPIMGLEAEGPKGIIAAPGLVRGMVRGAGVPASELE